MCLQLLQWALRELLLHNLQAKRKKKGKFDYSRRHLRIFILKDMLHIKSGSLHLYLWLWSPNYFLLFAAYTWKMSLPKLQKKSSNVLGRGNDTVYQMSLYRHQRLQYQGQHGSKATYILPTGQQMRETYQEAQFPGTILARFPLMSQ